MYVAVFMDCWVEEYKLVSVPRGIYEVVILPFSFVIFRFWVDVNVRRETISFI